MIQTPSARAFRPLHFSDHPDALGAVAFPVADHLLRRGLLQEGPRLMLAAGDPTQRLEDIRAELFREGWIEPERGEQMPVTAGPHGVELARLDRSALRILGFWAQKVHINGLVEPDGAGGLSVWISRRSELAASNPGRWDTLVAGGRAAGRSLAQTAAQEGWEEAGIDPCTMEHLQRTRELPVQYVSPRGFHQELLVMHDLRLPADFHAICHDGEIDQSLLLPFDEMTARLAKPQEFKFSSYLVLTDLVARRQAGADCAGAPATG